ncbi:MAG: energy transducer TonB [Terriglobales bacterium]
MRNATKGTLVLCTFLLLPFSSFAQTSPDLWFGGHTIGEPVAVFFSAATVAESKQLAKDYCKSLLDDAKMKGKVQQADDVAKNGGAFVLNKKDFAFLDVDNCRQVIAALNGEQAHVGGRLASEIGKGSAFFTAGRLSALNLMADSYTEAVADMERRFGAPGQKDTVSRVGWPPLQEMRWERDGILAAVWKKDKFSDGAVIAVGLLEPPYDSFLRGSPAPQSSVIAKPPTDSSESCKATQDASKRVHISQGITAGLLARRVRPVYPESARQNGIQGAVVLAAVIDECGRVVNLKPISGPEELIPAAMTAVKQWLYRPFMSSGQRTPIETQVKLSFTLVH